MMMTMMRDEDNDDEENYDRDADDGEVDDGEDDKMTIKTIAKRISRVHHKTFKASMKLDRRCKTAFSLESQTKAFPTPTFYARQ